jgi:hypothetical protein
MLAGEQQDRSLKRHVRKTPQLAAVPEPGWYGRQPHLVMLS